MKKTISILIFTLVLSNVSFASGWQFGFSVPLGASISFYDVNFAPDAPKDYINSYNKSKGTAGFDAGFNIQFGYLVSNGDKGASLLLELGYAHDSFGLKGTSKDNNIESKIKEYYTFENLSIGILPKFHNEGFEFGLGVGVKIPLYLTHSAELLNNNVGTKTYSYYGVSDLKNIMKNSVMAYVKLTFDYAFYISDETAILLGAYLGSDFGLNLRGAERVNVDSRLLSSFDVGVQLGFRFGDGIYDFD